jgi:hypothetical protein
MATIQPAAPTVDHALVRELKVREDARFAAEHPRSAALRDRGLDLMPNGLPMAWLRGSYHHIPMWVAQGRGARFTDVDGHTYSDFNIADMSMFCGYAPEPLVRAVSERDGKPIPASDRGRPPGLGRAPAPLRPPKVAIHAVRLAGEHRGDPRRPRRDRPAEGADVRREVSRAYRRGVGPARGERDGGSRGTRAAVGGLRPHTPRAVQRRGRAFPGAPGSRCRDRPDRAGADEQSRPDPSRARISRVASSPDEGGGDAPRARRDPHPGRRAGRLDSDVGARIRTS